MAGKELDRGRVQAAGQVAKQHPGLLAVLAAPAVIVVAVGWFIWGSGVGLFLLVAFGALGAVALSRLLRAR